MKKDDYILNTSSGDLLVEIEKRDINAEIVDALVAERKKQQKTQQQVADFVGMDRANIRNMHRILEGDSDGKIYKLLTFSQSSSS